MIKEIIINSSTTQTRIAINEDGTLVDFFVDNPEKRRTVGDIYLGRIARVLPGIKAAFVDIGQKHDAFLHFSDVGNRLQALQGMINDDDDDDENNNFQESEMEDDESGEQKNSSQSYQQIIENQISKLKKGQEILVQVIKEPVGNKGVRVTSSISIPGRFCVLLPYDNKIGISKKISDFKERRRLRKLARSIMPDNCGLIIRTAAKDQSEESLLGDLGYLIKGWEKIQGFARHKKPPFLVYEDLSTTISVMRDFFTPDIGKVFIDDKKLYKEIRSYVKFIQPSLIDKIDLFRGNEPIFEAFKIEGQINTMMSRKVPLPSGGHIVIDHTEAMYVIDVNSGRYAAKKDQESNSLKTDLEAAREIVRQLRLRDIGGLVVIDFIDLEDEKNRKKIYDELKKEFKKDRAKVALLPMTDFGLIQITRQRIRENIIQSMNEECPYCSGTGLIMKKSNTIHEIQEWLKKYKSGGKEAKLIIKVHPDLGKKLKEGFISTLTKMRFKYSVKLKLETDPRINPAKYKFISFETGREITDEYI